MDVNFPQLEEKILKRWKEQKAFEKSIKRRKKSPPFVFYEGPPTANGKPGIHHVLSRSFKDIICRYKTMRGFLVERKAGWDTHGLAVEIETEKKLGLKSKKDIEQYGIEKFNTECKKSVWEYKQDWENLTERMGFWIDLEHPYITYQTSYLETLWFIIKVLWQKGLLYKGYKVVPYCTRCGTPLSSHELAQGYKTIENDSVYVKFRMKPGQKIGNWVTNDRTYILSWTTTPWTLPGNVALAVGETIKYQVVSIKEKSENYILAKDLVEKTLGATYEILDTISGKDLVGLSYEQLFPIESLRNEKSHKIYTADFVTTTNGTGVVHTAVMYGEDDYNLGVQAGLPQHHTVGETGMFTKEVPGLLAGLPVKAKETDEKIFAYLKENNTILAVQKYSHEYPFCWRCSTPLLYYAKDSWFVNMQKVKRELIANNGSINWVPSHVKEGRMGEWLKEVKDWAFSRERYWGTPLPVWECKKCNHIEVIGSVQELEKRAHALPHNKKGEVDLHRPYVDDIVFACVQCKTGVMRRVKEVVDVWYDSGAMPFAQNYWMGEKKPKEFPADYIVEGIDQTRGWFYTLLAVSTLLGFGASYKNVISTGHVLDEKGEKMSKSKGNTVSPWDIITKYGIDAVRWYFYTINNPGDPKLFSEKDIQAATRNFLLTLWNCFVFYKTYAVKLNTKYQILNTKHVLDKWILSRLNGTTKDVTDKLDSYDITGAGRAIQDFVVNDLSLWYIRRSRQRAKDACGVLGFVLSEVCKLAAPFIPFLAEHIFQGIGHKESVHWQDWPFPSAAKRGLAQGKSLRDEKLETQMTEVRIIVAKALAERAKSGIKVRQPLASLKIRPVIRQGAPSNDGAKSEIRNELLNLIKDEVNVKQVIFDKGLKTEVELDTLITPELKEEGMVREIVRTIQGLRKEAGYKPGQKATLYYEGDEQLKTIIRKHQNQIQKIGALVLATGKRPAKFNKEKDVMIENLSLHLVIKT
ncbi:MAG: isoleucyl-tRNA synthetase [Parcubacteria group bacterium Greene0416_39]|nr:MAG: isoleucyl-tRNA synthetase [Parcubacteria group bacterium Greene0416_39]TSC97341.1 MAG: isoleucyl-tRNA synthetase [Parcubacteria group bacterium Greene1014_47]